MTLILNRISQQYITQVTDRLIATGGGEQFDTKSNKNIVYSCQDAIVAIAYTGIAFLSNVPTDQWLVETITSQIFERTRKPAAIAPTNWSSNEGIGQTMLRVQSALKRGTECISSHWKKQWREQPFDLIFAGWHWNQRGRNRPILGCVSKKPGEDNAEVGYWNRLWHYRQPQGIPFLIYAAPKTNYSLENIELLQIRLRNKQWQETESILVEEIRNVSRSIKYVGRDALSITLSPPDIARGIVTDHSENSRFHKIQSSFAPNLEAEVHLSPWLIGPGFIQPPALLSHSQEIQLGHYTIILSAPNKNGPRFFGSLERPKI